jgi:hypothetical protein
LILLESRFKPPSVLYRQRRTRLLVLVAALVASLLLALGFWLGQQAAYSGMGVDSALSREMQRKLPAARGRFSVPATRSIARRWKWCAAISPGRKSK